MCTCRRPYPGKGPDETDPGPGLAKTMALRREMSGSGSSVVTLTRLQRFALTLRPAHLLPPKRPLDTPLSPAASPRRTGACYPALRYLPGRDFHPLVQSNLQDANIKPESNEAVRTSHRSIRPPQESWPPSFGSFQRGEVAKCRAARPARPSASRPRDVFRAPPVVTSPWVAVDQNVTGTAHVRRVAVARLCESLQAAIESPRATREIALGGVHSFGARR